MIPFLDYAHSRHSPIFSWGDIKAINVLVKGDNFYLSDPMILQFTIPTLGIAGSPLQVSKNHIFFCTPSALKYNTKTQFFSP